jgi:hypothetical protein
MHPVAMQKHIGDKLVWLKILRLKKMKTEDLGKINIKGAFECQLSQEKQPVYDQQIFNNRRKQLETGGTILIVTHVFRI